jgi:transcriptional regulator with XRE-family HTH domain
MDTILTDNAYMPDEFNPLAILKSISRQFRLKRLEVNITQSELASKSGVSLGSIKRFETKSEISLKNLVMIALVLGSTEEFLQLFTRKDYKSIEDVISAGKVKTRKRAR